MSGSGLRAPLPYPAALDRQARAVLALTSASGVWIAVARPGIQGGALVPVVAVGVHPSGPVTLDPAETPPLARHIIDVAAHGQYLVTSANLATDARFHGIETRPFGSILCIPIHEGGQPFVALVAARARAEEFDERQRQFALVYAEQIAMTIHLLDAAALHEAQARERAAQLDAMRALTSGLDAQAAVTSIASALTRVIACDAALIYRFEARVEALRLVAGLGVDANRLAGMAISIQDNRSLAARVARERKARANVLLPEDQAGPLTGILATNGPAWLMCEPLVAQGRLLGVLMLARARAFEPGEQLALVAFTALAAAALERGELFDGMRAQRDQRDAMFAAASDAFALIDDELQFVEVNQAFASYLGTAPEALRGQVCYAALNDSPAAPPSPESCLLCHGACRVRACLEGSAARGPFACAFPPPRDAASVGTVATAGPEFSVRDVSFTLTPVAGPAGRQALLVGRDISDERDLERQRMEFLELLAHEVRQPLHIATINLERALYYSSPDLSLEERRRMERLAMGATRHASAGVADIVTVSQRAFGRFTVNPVPGDLYAVARDAANEVGALAVAYDVRLVVDGEEALPPALIDAMRAQQVARNLLMNALRFTPPGGWVRITTRAGSADGGQWIFLEVEDSGPGIPAESLERVFERRYQAQTPLTRGRPPGSGMGLAVVRYIMDGHGGGYRAQNRPGGGARFTMRFPLA